MYAVVFYLSYDRTISGVTTPCQSGPVSDANEGVLCISQSSSITEATPSDCLVSLPRHFLGGVLPLCRDAVGVFYRPNRLGKQHLSSHAKTSWNLQSQILKELRLVDWSGWIRWLQLCWLERPSLARQRICSVWD